VNRRLQNLAESLGVVVLLQVATPQAQAQAPATPKDSPAVERGRTVFASRCGFCHGRDAQGGETGPDLTKSELVDQDRGGDKIGSVVRDGRVDKGMPAIRLSDADLAATVAFIKSRTAGARRLVASADLETGNAEAGRKYFEGAGECTTCHSPTGDLAGVAKRLKDLELLRRMLYPTDGKGATVAVALPSGEKISGALAYRDEFTIALTDESGRYRSWLARQVTFTVTNPLDAHADRLGKYTDEDMHNVLAYLRTLR
jgi:cytochrome c oxidase cbb3-type subunit 3